MVIMKKILLAAALIGISILSFHAYPKDIKPVESKLKQILFSTIIVLQMWIIIKCGERHLNQLPQFMIVRTNQL